MIDFAPSLLRHYPSFCVCKNSRVIQQQNNEFILMFLVICWIPLEFCRHKIQGMTTVKSHHGVCAEVYS
jgi:hypothetical protein